MTDRREEDVQLSDPPTQDGSASAEDQPEQDEAQGEGRHGRPSDDADPGHS